MSLIILIEVSNTSLPQTKPYHSKGSGYHLRNYSNLTVD